MRMETTKKEIAGNSSRTRGLRRGGSDRPKGKPNEVTAEIRTLAQRLLTDPDYLDNLRRRLIEGTRARLKLSYTIMRMANRATITEHLDIDPSTWADEQLDAYDAGLPIVQVLAMGFRLVTAARVRDFVDGGRRAGSAWDDIAGRRAVDQQEWSRDSRAP